MTLAIVVVVCVTVAFTVAVIVGRPVTFSYHGLKASVEEIKKAVGQPDEGGDVVTRLDSLSAEISAVNERLDRRTHVTRAGSTQPEELAAYTQERMHDVLNLLTVIKLQVDTMWTAMRNNGFDLPDLNKG